MVQEILYRHYGDESHCGEFCLSVSSRCRDRPGDWTANETKQSLTHISRHSDVSCLCLQCSTFLLVDILSWGRRLRRATQLQVQTS